MDGNEKQEDWKALDSRGFVLFFVFLSPPIIFPVHTPEPDAGFRSERGLPLSRSPLALRAGTQKHLLADAG